MWQSEQQKHERKQWSVMNLKSYSHFVRDLRPEYQIFILEIEDCAFNYKSGRGTGCRVYFLKLDPAVILWLSSPIKEAVDTVEQNIFY